MDYNSINSSSSSMQTSIDRFFPATSTTTSPHFLDTTFLDNAPSFPTTATATATSSWAHPTPEQPTTKPPSAAAPGGPTGRPSKKRSRASRRAPTTVLTTDTSNFRAMVQEFTGIPSPPFSPSASLHFPRPRPRLSPPPSFLLKPFHHNFQPTSTSPSPSPLPTINFQSLLQSQLVSLPHQHQQQQAIAAAAASSSSSSSGELRLPGVIGSGAGDQTRQQQQQQQQDAIASCKMSLPGSISTEFHSEKGTEGLMDSWICSSD